MFTVIDVIRELGFETETRMDWSIGHKLRDAWHKDSGHLPVKGLRTKTCGRGVHCFALYPDQYRDEARFLVARECERRDADLKRQLDLPF
jgi:hypothetical protein